jgi:hypothetical protein
MHRSMRFGFRQLLSISCVLLMAGMGTVAVAQPPAAPAPQGQTLAPQQLENLVAPIALYPDPLLGQVLAASTYPVELVEAQQWLQANTSLHGQQLTDAARQQNWDASVQAMVAMPDVLTKLNQDIQWTTDLGNAFLAQPADVMAAVQRMRSRAEANGKLQSNQQETVTTQTQNGQQAIEIQPADPQVLYAPNYDPGYVWGPPIWGAYPPLYYPSYGFGWYPGFNIGLCFGGWGGWGWGGWGWGGGWGSGVGEATTTTTNQPVSNLVIDLFDASTKKLLWRGLATEDLSSNAQKNTKSLDGDVAKMFKGFPPKPGK